MSPPPWPLPDPEVSAALQAAFADGSWGRYHGGNVERLEARLADYHDCSHVLTCSSGTLAVEVALRAVGVEPCDEVIMGAYDYESNFLSVHAIGAFPVLVDVAPGNACLDPSAIDAAIGPRTKAILASHLHGGLVPMQELTVLAGKRGLRVVEDAAQASGALVQGRRAGTWGDAGVLSFGGSKLLTAGRGGAILTRHADVHQRAKLWLQRGVQAWAALSELQAAVLLPQLKLLDEYNSRRARAVQQLVFDLEQSPALTPFVNEVAGKPSYYKLGFWYDAAKFRHSREQFIGAMRGTGIGLDVGFRAAHMGRAPARFRRVGDLPQATRAHEAVVVLHHPILLASTDELKAVSAALRETVP